MIEALTNYYNFNTKCNFKHNEKKEGIEVYFTSVPTKEEREKLKESNWHWNHKKECWYVKEKLLRDMNILSEEIEEEIEEKPTKKEKITKKVEKTEELSKQVLSKIKTILNSNKKMPSLEGYTPIIQYTGTKIPNYRVAFTDSYRLCILNQEYLPFKVAFTKDSKIKKDYLKEFKDKIEGEINNSYPNLEAVIPQTEPEDTFTINVEEVKEKAKGNKGKNNLDKRIIKYTTEKENKTISIDSQYLSDMVTLLRIKDKEIKMNFYGEFKPATYENENGYYLTLPIKTY